MTEFLTPIEWHYATKWEQMTILDDPIFGAVMASDFARNHCAGPYRN